MRCLVCNSTDKWELVDNFRIKPMGMSICTHCGMVSYPSRWKSEEEIKAHYRKDYRNPPTSSNFFTGQRKIYFHNAFLQDVFKDWAEKGKKAPQVTEIGAAYGLALQWIRSAYKGAEVTGTELTTSYRRNAFHEFGINLTEDFDATRKYDLIMSYKVAEHILDVDKHLRKYAECLTDDGLLYISVPTWFDSMCNFGLGGFDLEYYYDPNHINVWTRKLFEQVLKKCGLEIVKSDFMIYDSTYLCKRNDALMNEPLEFENPNSIKDKMDKIKKAYLAFTSGNHDAALALYPDYPTAHINRAEMIRKQAFANGWPWVKENIIDYAFKSCPCSADIFVMACDLSMRAEKWEDAITYAEQGLKAKPENPSSLNQLINIMREMALRAPDDKTRVHYYTQGRNIAKHLRDVSTQHFREAMDMIYLFNAQLDVVETKFADVIDHFEKEQCPDGR